jgi:hypothetical protein
MGKVLIFVYGVLSGLLFLLAFLYVIAFLGNFGTLPYITKTIDSGTSGPLGQAFSVGLSLIVLFAATAISKMRWANPIRITNAANRCWCHF